MRLARIFSVFPRRKALRDLVGALTLGELLPLAIAIFTLFAVLGPITDLLSGTRLSLAQLLATCAFSGTIALLYAFASVHGRWTWFAVALALQFSWGPGPKSSTRAIGSSGSTRSSAC